MTAATVSQYAERLRTMSWRDMAKCAWLILLAMMTLKLLVPASLGDGVRPLILIAPLLPFIAKDLSHWPDALARLRAALADRAWRRVLAACWPPELIGLLRIDGAMRAGFLNWLRRRPQPVPPAGEALTYLERGSYRTAVAIVLFSTLFELPLDAALMPLLVKDAGTLHLLHLLVALGCISTLVWLLGDRWHIGRGCHVLTAAGLELRIGARTSATIPLDAIADCRRVDLPVADWCRRHGVERHKTLLVSPLDKPNAILILNTSGHTSSAVRLTHMGVERTGLDCVFLYVDRPDRLMHLVRSERQQ